MTKPKLRQALRMVCKDWAEDHTHAANLAMKLGIPREKIDGDSYYVPCIMDILDMIEAQVTQNREATT